MDVWTNMSNVQFSYSNVDWLNVLPSCVINQSVANYDIIELENQYHSRHTSWLTFISNDYI